MIEINGRAQETPERPRLRVAPSPTVSPTPLPSPRTDDQEQVRIVTEEVRVPLTARDEFGHFDPTLSVEDILVFEDDVPQEVRSVARVPANVVLLLDAGGEQNPAMRPQTTRDVARELVARLRAEDSMAIMQFSNWGIEALHEWTTDKESSVRALRRRFRAGRTARLTEALRAAANKLKERSVGNRHIVLITDGVETNRDSAAYRDALKELNRAQATVHVISYTQLARERLEERERAAPQQSERDRTVEQATIGVDPTSPNSPQRGGAPVTPGSGVGNVARFGLTDFLRRRAYRRALERSATQLQSLAEETGGRVLLPSSTSQMTAQGGEVAREIDAQYTVTYTPRRPLTDVITPEYRRLRIVPRRPNLNVQARRGYVASPSQQ